MAVMLPDKCRSAEWLPMLSPSPSPLTVGYSHPHLTLPFSVTYPES